MKMGLDRLRKIIHMLNRLANASAGLRITQNKRHFVLDGTTDAVKMIFER